VISQPLVRERHLRVVVPSGPVHTDHDEIGVDSLDGGLAVLAVGVAHNLIDVPAGHQDGLTLAVAPDRRSALVPSDSC
jgi:hypothetical protein